jgi:hypothetical protein
MIEMLVGALLVVAIVAAGMWLNTAAPFVLAFIIGMAAGLALGIAVALWMASQGFIR